MSGCSYSDICPNCGGALQSYSDTKPFDFSTGNCVDCGFYYTVRTGQLSLKDLNSFRSELLEMDALKRRKKASIDSELVWK